jgi:hypothetical protein
MAGSNVQFDVRMFVPDNKEFGWYKHDNKQTPFHKHRRNLESGIRFDIRVYNVDAYA